MSTYKREGVEEAELVSSAFISTRSFPNQFVNMVRSRSVDMRGKRELEHWPTCIYTLIEVDEALFGSF